MPRRKLTDQTVKALVAKPAAGRVDYFDKVLPGFGIRVSSTGAASWFVFYRIDGKLVRDVFDRYSLKGLAAAREEARKRLELVGRGRDPRTEEARQKAQEAKERSETLRALAPLYKSTHLDTLRTGARLHREIEQEILPEIGDVPVRQITRARGMVLLDLIEADHGRTSRDRRLALLKHWWGWLETRELVDSNVLTRIPLYGTKKRDRVLSDGELVEVWNAAGTLTSTRGPAVRMLMLTGLRRNECFRSPVAELDAPARLLTIDGSRMKAGLAHEVPLSDACMAALSTLPRWNEPKTYLFPSLRSLDAPIGDHGQINWRSRCKDRSANPQVRTGRLVAGQGGGAPPRSDYVRHIHPQERNRRLRRGG
jgi:integrase